MGRGKRPNTQAAGGCGHNMEGITREDVMRYLPLNPKVGGTVEG